MVTSPHKIYFSKNIAFFEKIVKWKNIQNFVACF